MYTQQLFESAPKDRGQDVLRQLMAVARSGQDTDLHIGFEMMPLQGWQANYLLGVFKAIRDKHGVDKALEMVGNFDFVEHALARQDARLAQMRTAGSAPDQRGVDENIVAGIVGHEIEKFLDEPNPKTGMAEGSEEDNPVANAIINRILRQRPDLLSTHGPERLGDAIASVADFVGDVEEIGTSDVSGWVRQVERDLVDNQNMAEADYKKKDLGKVRRNQLNELDVLASRHDYVKMLDGNWIDAEYRQTDRLGTPSNPVITNAELRWVPPQEVRTLGLDQRINDRVRAMDQDNVFTFNSAMVPAPLKTKIGQWIKTTPAPKQGVAEGYSNTTFKVDRRKLNVPALIQKGAIFVTYPHGEQGWETDNKEDWAFSLISLYNVLQGGWPSEAKKYLKPESYRRAEQQINSSAPNLGSDQLVYDGKYNQILWSIKKLGIPDNVAFLDKGQQGVAEEHEEYCDACDRVMSQCICNDKSVDQIEEDLRKWFKEKWVRFGPDGKIRGDCARGDDSEGKPKCLPQSKAHALGKKGRASAAAKKRREDPNPERRGPAKNVATKVKEQGVAEGSDQVRRIQQFLNKKFNANLDVDGIMGELTKQSINKFLPAAKKKTAPQPEKTTAVQGLKTKSNEAEDKKECPPATQDIELNLKNRQKAIDEYGYGPLNPAMPNVKFWAKKVDEWNLDSAEEAKQSLCGNCAAFDMTSHMLDCIAQGIGSEPGSDPHDTIEAGHLGYCKFLKFKCASERTCDAWVTGGPIVDKPEVTEQAETCPDCGGPMFSELLINEKQDACYYKVKSRYKVWPSAYASGALVQCRKKGAANWGSKSKNEGVAEAQSAKTGIYQTDVLGAKAYHAKCMEPNCEWESKRFDSIKQAQAAAQKHAKGHFEQGMAEGPDDDIWGPQGNFAGDKPVNISTTVSKKPIAVGQLVKVSDGNIRGIGEVEKIKGEQAQVWIDSYARSFVVPLSALVAYSKKPAADVEENFADGKKPGRKGLAKRMGVPTKASVSTLRKIAKNSTGEKQRMAHWMANMKAGKQKNEDAEEETAQSPLADRLAQLHRVNQGLEEMLQAMRGSRKPAVEDSKTKQPEPPEADYDDEYQAMVKRVGALAKQGPRKTVWDPEKRVYKTVPINPPAK